MREIELPEKRKEGWRTDPTKGETQERRGDGNIVNIGSAASFVGFPRAGIYVASKHAVHGLTQTAALELAADTDTRVSLLVPGSVKPHNYELFSESRDELNRQLIQAHPTRQILSPVGGLCPAIAGSRPRLTAATPACCRRARTASACPSGQREVALGASCRLRQ